ncbi:MAG: branched-chain amino acid ABC transporter substrate-binding protein [Proteobacteria bacterium]|nr:branched-chain amino acid ABC transporter substrate-binding protein [Pseudomonadota bacterium]
MSICNRPLVHAGGSGLVLLALAFLVVGLGPAPARAGDITIAVVAAMTGPLEATGKELRQGAEAAVEAINAKGGLLGRKVRLLVRDDQCSPDKAVPIAKELVAGKVDMVVGHECSGASIPASVIYDAAKVVQISAASTNPAYTERGLPFVFRTCGRDDVQGFVAAEFISRRLRNTTVAIIHDTQVYGKGFTDIAREHLHKARITEVFTETITVGQSDFTPLLERMRRAGVELVLFGGYAPEAEALLRQARASAMRFRLLGPDALMNKSLAQAGRAADGTLVTFAPNPADDRNNRDVVAAFKARGFAPDGYTLYSYAAVQLWAEAVAKAGGLEAQKVAAALKGGPLPSVLGRTVFNAKGDISATGFVLYVYSNGRPEYVD